MSVGRRLAGAVIMALAVGSCAYAAVFNITAYGPDGALIAATDLKIGEVYAESTGATVDPPITPTAYPDTRTVAAPTTLPSLTYTATQKATSKSVSISLNCNKPPAGTVQLTPIIP